MHDSVYIRQVMLKNSTLHAISREPESSRFEAAVVSMSLAEVRSVCHNANPLGSAKPFVNFFTIISQPKSVNPRILFAGVAFCKPLSNALLAASNVSSEKRLSSLSPIFSFGFKALSTASRIRSTSVSTESTGIFLLYTSGQGPSDENDCKVVSPNYWSSLCHGQTANRSTGCSSSKSSPLSS